MQEETKKLYLIPAENMERLNKKLASARKKCALCNCSFSYEEHEPEYKTFEKSSGEKVTYKYIPVTVEGVARFEKWRFIATIEHTTAGNIIRKYDHEHETPERFYNCAPYCEHCNTARTRKDTYIIYNEDTHEYKQIGKSCLILYTGGLSAENIAFFASLYDACEANTAPDNTIQNKRYYDVKEVLLNAFEVVRVLGYRREAFNRTEKTTKELVDCLMHENQLTSKSREELRALLDSHGFNKENSIETTENALKWILSVDTTNNDYLRNLSILARCGYSETRDFGLLSSFPVAYSKALEKQEKEVARNAEKQQEQKTSSFVGEVGKRVNFAVASIKLLTSFENVFGYNRVVTTYIYKLTDNNNNVFIWKTQNALDMNADNALVITGTIKEHETREGVKQNIITRCKVATA